MAFNKSFVEELIGIAHNVIATAVGHDLNFTDKQIQKLSGDKLVAVSF